MFDHMSLRKTRNQKHQIRSRLVSGALAMAAAVSMPTIAAADEGGVSFWVPGFYGSLASAPQQPGFSLTSIYYHTSVSAGADVAAARQVTRGNITANLSANLTGSLNASGDLGFAIPSYTFAEPVLGGQAGIAMIIPIGTTKASVELDADRAGRPDPVLDRWRAHRRIERVRRPGSDILASLEHGREQFHDLCHGGHPGRGL